MSLHQRDISGTINHFIKGCKFMNTYSNIFELIAVQKSYDLYDGQIVTTDDVFTLVNLNDYSSESLQNLSNPYLENRSKREEDEAMQKELGEFSGQHRPKSVFNKPYQRRTDIRIYLEFSSCLTPEDALAWIKKFGFPWDTTKSEGYTEKESRKFLWWKDNLPNKFPHLANKNGFSVDEFLFWAKVASWLLTINNMLNNNQDDLASIDVPDEIKLAFEIMTESSFAAFQKYIQKSESGTLINHITLIRAILVRILEISIKNIPEEIVQKADKIDLHRIHLLRGRHFFNTMQYVFYNIYLVVTESDVSPIRCKCGRWFVSSRPQRAIYCSLKCQEKYKKRSQRRKQINGGT